jgi:hypothetical protein
LQHGAYFEGLDLMHNLLRILVVTSKCGSGYGAYDSRGMYTYFICRRRRDRKHPSENLFLSLSTLFVAECKPESPPSEFDE